MTPSLCRSCGALVGTSGICPGCETAPHLVAHVAPDATAEACVWWTGAPCGCAACQLKLISKHQHQTQRKTT